MLLLSAGLLKMLHTDLAKIFVKGLSNQSKHLQGGPKSELLYIVHIFAKYRSIFLPVDSVRTLLLSGMRITFIMSLHYFVKHRYAKTNNIVQSLVVASLVMGQFKEVPLLESLLIS